MDQEKKQKLIERYNDFLNNGMNKEDVLYILRLMFELTPFGFERYISAYFHKMKGYKTKVIGGYHDLGIDIEGSRILGHKILNLAIQCKKRYKEHIKKDKILEFDYDAENREKTHINPQLYFFTTMRANPDAKKVANKKNIKLTDCRGLLLMKKYYNLDDFEKDFGKTKYNFWTYKKRLFTRTNVKSIIENI